MAEFGFGIKSKRLGGQGGGLLDAIDFMTGNTPQQKLDDFLAKDAPDIAQKINDATTLEEINRHATDFFLRGTKAGLSAAQLDKLSEGLVSPALNKLGSEELNKLGGELKGGTTISPKTYETEEDESSIFNVENRPARGLQESDVPRLVQIDRLMGGKGLPSNLPGLFNVPYRRGSEQALTEERQARTSRERTLGRIAEEQEGAIGELPEDQLENAPPGLTLKGLGRATQGRGLPATLSKKEKTAPIQVETAEGTMTVDVPVSRIFEEQERGKRQKTAIVSRKQAGEMSGSQLVGLRNSLLRQRQNALKAAELAVGDEETQLKDEAGGLQTQIDLLDEEIQRRGKFQLKTSKAEAEPPAKRVMPAMPDAAQNAGRTIRDTETGKRFKSDGKKWVEIR